MAPWRAMFICTLKTAVRFSMCALVVTQIKKDAKVNGNITLDFINSVTDNPIYGGGYARSSYSAEVTGSICINLSGLNNGFGQAHLRRRVWEKTLQ